MSKTTRAEMRRLERQRRQLRNILILIGTALIIGAAYWILSTRPVNDLIVPTGRSFPVPVDGRTIGDPNAPILIEAFEDFQCPSCLDFTQNHEDLIINKYVNTGIARFTFRNFTIIGPESVAAANAALCANDQGQFWNFHDWLYTNQRGENSGAFSDKRLTAIAEQSGLNMDTWQACFDAKTFDDVVTADYSEGRERGVSGTPTIFVNGVPVASYDFITVGQAVDAAVAQLNP